MAHRFTCGEKRIWQIIEKSQNIMKLIVGPKVDNDAIPATTFSSVNLKAAVVISESLPKGAIYASFSFPIF